MALMENVQFVPSRVRGHRFHPIGLVLHRTEAGYQHCLDGFAAGPKAPHFLVGKCSGEAVQLVDTATARHTWAPAQMTSTWE